jgi:hypothetical protein
MKGFYRDFINNGIYCKVNKDDELIVHYKSLRPIFPDEIIIFFITQECCKDIYDKVHL